MNDSIKSVEVKSPEMLKLIAQDAPVEQICTGFWFTEGPIWNAKEQCLYFSDMPGDVRRRWSAADGVKEVRQQSVNVAAMRQTTQPNDRSMKRKAKLKAHHVKT